MKAFLAVLSALSLIAAAPYEDNSVPSNFDVSTGLQKTGGTGKIPPSNGTDPVGAFRFLCGAGQLSYDDPIVYPGQPGASHLHQYYGNLGANANSTFYSLRLTGESTCGNKVNRSGYWMPALLDGRGHVIQPDFVNIYYKRLPVSDTHCAPVERTDLKALGICIPIPKGLRFIFGYDMLTQTAQTGHHQAGCYANYGQGKMLANAETIGELAKLGCPVGASVKLSIGAPECWDGKNLDSPNHRSHVSYASYANVGYRHCPTTHPYVIPTFTIGAFYSVVAGDDLRMWSFSSDMMHPELPAGSTFHADWFGAWDDTVLTMWSEGCINKHLNCHSGDLGNGLQIIGAWQPSYGIFNPNRLVPVPPKP